MAEVDVALTDYVLFALCSVFAWRISTRARPDLKSAWTWFFATIAFASLTGGTVHGFFNEESSLGHRILWPATMLGIGATASATWCLAGWIALKKKHHQRVMRFAVGTFSIFTVAVFFISQSFLVVILDYLPATIALLTASIIALRRKQGRSYLWIIGGILISFLGVYVQQARIAIHPQYFTHNSTYHLIQAFALWAIYLGAQMNRMTR